ncbi:hypothetical protein [Parasphingopyxis sp.]|uniref:hypothetical protein n=1 Tax=Parasphingopyxis sp. TaxID=1920299 RepID=UPI00261E0F55|nr:hypothetical protein [Parasphingopyxis sp.]
MNKFSRAIMLCAIVAGLFYAAGTITAFLAGYEWIVVLILLAGIGKAAALFAPDAPLRNAFLGGFLMALTAVWTQGLFLDAYFAANPAYRVDEVALGLGPQSWTFIMAPLGALVAGGISLAAAALVRVLVKIFGKRVHG